MTQVNGGQVARDRIAAVSNSATDAGDDCTTYDVQDVNDLIEQRDELLEALNAMCGFLLNIRADIEEDTKRSTTITTIEGGLKFARVAIFRARRTA